MSTPVDVIALCVAFFRPKAPLSSCMSGEENWVSWQPPALPIGLMFLSFSEFFHGGQRGWGARCRKHGKILTIVAGTSVCVCVCVEPKSCVLIPRFYLPTNFNLLMTDFFFQILAHPVFKM